jgi:hypothetical protein
MQIRQGFNTFTLMAAFGAFAFGIFLLKNSSVSAEEKLPSFHCSRIAAEMSRFAQSLAHLDSLTFEKIATPYDFARDITSRASDEVLVAQDTSGNLYYFFRKEERAFLAQDVRKEINKTEGESHDYAIRYHEITSLIFPQMKKLLRGQPLDKSTGFERLVIRYGFIPEGELAEVKARLLEIDETHGIEIRSLTNIRTDWQRANEKRVVGLPLDFYKPNSAKAALIAAGAAAFVGAVPGFAPPLNGNLLNGFARVAIGAAATCGVVTFAACMPLMFTDTHNSFADAVKSRRILKDEEVPRRSDLQ